MNPGNSRLSWMTPLGAWSTGGTCFAPAASVAKQASITASNHPLGIKLAFLSSGTPVNQRIFAASRVTVRYAPNLSTVLINGGVVEIHEGA